MFKSKKPKRQAAYLAHPYTASKRGGNDKRYGLKAAMFAAPVLILGVGGYLANSKLNEVTMNEETFCYEQGNQDATAFLIDYSVTEFASPTQIMDLENALVDRAFEQLGPNQPLHIFSTERDKLSTIVKPVFTICRPVRTLAEQSQTPGPEKNQAELDKTYEKAKEKFYQEVAQRIAESKTEEKVAKTSPILEQIQGISRYYRDKPEMTLDNLFIYTDGIQTSPAASFCQTKGHLPPYPIFKKRRAYQKVKPAETLGGVKGKFLLVNWLVLPSIGLEYCTNQELYDFWEAYLKDHDTDIEMESLLYVEPETTQIEDGVEKPYACNRCHKGITEQEIRGFLG